MSGTDAATAVATTGAATPAEEQDNDQTVDIFTSYATDYAVRATQDNAMSLKEWLELCKTDSGAYATATERLLDAIGDPEIVDTSKDSRLGRIFENRTITRYPAFRDFYGMDDTIGKIVKFLRSAAQGAEEAKQVLYFLGPVGGGKSSLAQRIVDLMQKRPIYVVKAPNGEISPIHESPLGLFSAAIHGDLLKNQYGIPKRHVTHTPSPWLVKRLKEAGGDISKFEVVKMYPSADQQVAIARTEPGDENNQDQSTLIGKVDIRKLEEFGQGDADVYGYVGGLNIGHQGTLEFVEMFKAPIKMLSPILSATQDGKFVGTEQIGAMPWKGLIMAHSNESEWQKFRNNRDNEAFLDRVCTVKVPYSLQVREEIKIYKKMIDGSEFANKPCAPQTLEMLAQWSVLTRLKPVENSSLWTKMRVYDGESMKDKDTNAKPIGTYRDLAGVNEGMDGMSTRFAFKVLSDVFNYNANAGEEIGANPVHLLAVLEEHIREEDFGEDEEKRLIAFIKEELVPRYKEFIDEEIHSAYLDSFGEYGQNMFDRYIMYAEHWLDDTEYRDPQTKQAWNREELEKELADIERGANIANAKDFRAEVVRYVLNQRVKNGGQNPKWDSYNKLAEVLKKKMFKSAEDLLPVISFGAKSSDEDAEKHKGFVDRMMKRGYTESQTRLVVDWHIRALKMG